MKNKSFISIASLALVLSLSACGGRESKIDLNNLTGISKEEFTYALTQASVNSAKILSMTGDGTRSKDLTKLYTGGLSYLASSEKETISSKLVIGSNYTIDVSGVLKIEKADKSGKNKSETKEEQSYYLLKDPTITDNKNYDLCEYTKSESNGIINEQNVVVTPNIANDGNVNNVFNKFALSNSIICDLLNFSYTEYGKQGDDIIAYKKTTTQSTDSNPLYPNDTTKSVNTVSTAINAIQLSKDSSLGYVLKKFYVNTSLSYVTNFELKQIATPIVVSETSSTATLAYGERVSGRVGTYPVSTEKAKLFISSFAADSPYSLISSNDLNLNDVTAVEKSKNPNYKGTKYVGNLRITNSDSLYLYAFTTNIAIAETTPDYEKYGFSSIDFASIAFDTITDPLINNHKFIKFEKGLYSMTVEFNESNELTKLSISYYGNI